MAIVERRGTPGKLRIRALDPSGNPAAYVRVELVAAGASGAPPIDARPAGPGAAAEVLDRAGVVVVRSLTTNRDGFAIFSLGNIPATAGGLRIRFAGRPALTYEVGDLAAARAAAGVSQYVGYQLPTGSWGQPEPKPGPWLDDGLEADDVWTTPGVFPDLGHLEFGDEYCGRLVPNDRTVRVAHHNQLVRTRKDVVTCLADHDKSIHLDAGELIQYEIKATRLGYTFGDLLYSLPLAPCESVTLAISHWEQRQKARAEQQTVSVEKRSSSYYRQNALSETLSSLATNRHIGLATAGTASGFIGIWQVSFGGSVAASFDRKEFTSDATRNFSDSIQQAAEAYRNDHQVVVMEQWETEDQAVSYRTVCNNNHCHVLNIFYHEVLNNFRVATKPLGHRDVYLVPYDVYDFDAQLALCAKPFLLPYLLDDDVADCYRKLKSAGVAGGKSGASGKTVNQFKVEMNFLNALYFNPQWPFQVIVMLKVGGLQFFPLQRNDFWVAGTTYAYVVNTPDLDPDNIQSVGVRNVTTSAMVLAANQNPSIEGRLTIQSLTVSMKDSASAQWITVGTRTGYLNLRLDPGNTPGDLYLVELVQKSPDPLPPPDPSTAPKADEQECLDQVLTHLNCNKVYYSSLLAVLEDPNARICRFDKIICGTSGETLADLVVPEPVGIFGCSLAFPKAGSAYVPEDDPVVDERLLTLPTPGVFADAALGQCSACEKFDEKVYWDWSKTPCSCAGKDVTLKAPAESPLIQAGTSPFPALSTTVWATGAAPPSGEAVIANSLVGAFGGAMATAMLADKDSDKELNALKDMMAKMADVLTELIKAATKKDPKDSTGSSTGGH
jgi:hypothetical protein